MVVNDFHQDRAQSAARQLREAGLKASAQAADLTDRAAIFAMVERIQAEVGVVDIFVHNAGIPAQGWGYTPFLQSPESEWNAWLQLNLHGLMHACQAAARHAAKGLGPHRGHQLRRGAHGHGHGAVRLWCGQGGGYRLHPQSLGRGGPHGVTANALSLGTMNNWEGSEKIARKGTSVGRAGSPGCGCGRELSGIDRSGMGQRPSAAGQRRWSGGLSPTASLAAFR
jgi:3-oxoacyl-[acyl-carrier protein] reductase